MAEPAWQEPVRALIEAAWRQDAIRAAGDARVAEHWMFLRWLSRRDGLLEREYHGPVPVEPEEEQAG